MMFLTSQDEGGGCLVLLLLVARDTLVLAPVLQPDPSVSNILFYKIFFSSTKIILT